MAEAHLELAVAIAKDSKNNIGEATMFIQYIVIVCLGRNRVVHSPGLFVNQIYLNFLHCLVSAKVHFKQLM